SQPAQSDYSGEKPVLAPALPNFLPPRPSETENPLLSSFADYFHVNPQVQDRTVTVAGSPARIWSDQKQIWASPFHVRMADLRWIVPLAGATGFLIATDHHSISFIHGDPANRKESARISDAGVAAFGAAAATSFAFGTFTSNEHARQTGILTAEAMTDSLFVSEALKIATGRDRPSSSGPQGSFWNTSSLSSSFPSQHAALAWSAAAVLAREYPNTITQWSAYGLASLVSLSRITANSHFPSDVLVGAAAGYLIGRYVYHAHSQDDVRSRLRHTKLERDAEAAPTALVPTSNVSLGSVYVSLDSWIYPALRRLASLGYIPDQVSNLGPWTRLECAHQVQEAAAFAERIEDTGSSLNREALKLISDLQAAFNTETNAADTVRLESIYTRLTNISGAPLRDSYHFGQTIANDYGRPYGNGMNNVTGFSSYAVSGRFSAYVRGEYEEAPGAGPYSLAVRQFISGADSNPVQPAQPVAATNRFAPLEMYTGVQLGFENITFGKQSLWWGPDEDSAFSFSNNAAPFYSLRLAQTRPIVLPGLLSRLGKIRTEFIIGKLSGHQWPPRPFVNAQKISLDLTDNFEVGFTRSAFFGGVGHPLTLGTVERSLFSTSSTGGLYYGAANDPGDRHSGFDFRWRVPGLRRYVSVYSDSYADDDPNPLDNPKRAAWAPGLYLTDIPGLTKLDFRFETYSTWLYRKDQGGQFLYYNDQYHDSYTNDGYLLGSWIGRDARAYVATTSYWFSAKSRLQAQYRQIKSGNNFLPGGGTQTDVSLRAQWAPSSDFILSSELQGERYYIPVLGSARHDILASLQFTYYPRWAVQR
ncbi:MAG: phosphatase PAP2 family protein, partial [Acidobacteriaceae bacterium]|nr:phosphatase PAP2 family protein [Acidobacteriaceae bacterium]